jgi:hypothetical protein
VGGFRPCQKKLTWQHHQQRSPGQPKLAMRLKGHHDRPRAQNLMEAIYLKYSYDFRIYSAASQKRRVLYALT